MIHFPNQLDFFLEPSMVHKGSISGHQPELGILRKIHQIREIFEKIPHGSGTKTFSPPLNVFVIHIVIIHKLRYT